MHCDKCDVEVVNSDICPLCHTPLVEGAVSSGANKHARSKYITFTKWYIIAALTVFICSLIYNFVIPPKFAWSIYVAAGLIHIYYTVRITILTTYKKFMFKIIGQEIGVSLLLMIAGFIFGISEIIYLYLLPIITLSIVLFIIIYMVIAKNDRAMGSFGMFVLGLFSFIPLAITLISGNYYISSLIVTGVTNCATACLFLFGGKEVINTFKLIFHI